MKRFQRVNHFPAMCGITKKSSLATILNAIKDQFPFDFHFFPETWTLPLQMSRLKTDMKERRKKAINKGLSTPMYIIKPSDSAQGKGIFFASEFEQISRGINNRTMGKHRKGSTEMKMPPQPVSN